MQVTKFVNTYLYFMLFRCTAFLAIGLVACQTTSSPNNNATSDDIAVEIADTLPESPTTALPHYGFGGYYVLDYKYNTQGFSANDFSMLLELTVADPLDTLALKRMMQMWKSKKVVGLYQQGFDDNLFDMEGPGPGGVEWNADADLFCVLTTPLDSVVIKSVDIQLNGKNQRVLDVLPTIQSLDDGTAISFTIPAPQWEANLEDIRTIHHALYTADELNSDTIMLAWGYYTYVVLTVNKTNGTQEEHRGLFAIAYGE